jgi:hypothetical protein
MRAVLHSVVEGRGFVDYVMASDRTLSATVPALQVGDVTQSHGDAPQSALVPSVL